MTDTDTRSAAQAQGRSATADSERRRQRVLKALNDATSKGDQNKHKQDRPLRWSRSQLPLPPLRPSETDPRRRGPTGQGCGGRARCLHQLGVPVSRPGQRAPTLGSPRSTCSPTRTASVRGARRRHMARVRAQRPRRHRPAQANGSGTTHGSNSNHATTTSLGAANRELTAQLEHDTDHAMSIHIRHVHDTCCSCHHADNRPLTCTNAPIRASRRGRTPGEPAPPLPRPALTAAAQAFTRRRSAHARSHQINPVRWTHQRVPNRRLTRHDAVFGPHTQHGDAWVAHRSRLRSRHTSRLLQLLRLLARPARSGGQPSRPGW